MRTTVDLNARLLRDAKRRAADEGTTLKAVFVRALREYLGKPAGSQGHIAFSWRTERGQLRPGVRIEDRDSLFDTMEGW